MSALVPEPPALVRSPKEGQHHSHEPGHVLPQLSAALENPDIKALEWSEDGQGVLVHTELYEEEMGKNKELFSELVDLGCVAGLQAWLVAYGFKLKEEKVNSQVLLLQHPDFQRAPPTTEELGALAGNAGLSAKQKKKKKKKRKKKHGSTFRPSRGAMSQEALGLLQPMSYSPALAGNGVSASGSSCTSPGQPLRRRPLYQYINFDMPELMQPSSSSEEVLGLAEPSQVPTDPKSSTALQLDDTWANSASETPAPEAGDKYMQVDIDRMLRHAADLIPLLFPQYK